MVISPILSNDLPAHGTDQTKSNGQSPVAGYEGPSCPTTTCGECFQVCNAGGYDGASVGGVGNCITVNVIDVFVTSSSID